MKPTRRPARRAPKPDSDDQASVRSPRPFRSDRPEGPSPLRRGQEVDPSGGSRRWSSPKQPNTKPWARGPQSPGQKPQRPGRPGDREWPRRGSGPSGGGHPGGGNPQRASRPQHARPQHPRAGGKPAIREHPQYGTRIPPEELEFLNQHPQRREQPRGGRPQAPVHRGPRPHERPGGREDRRHDRPRRPDRSRAPRAGEGPPRPAPALEESPILNFHRNLNAYQHSAALFAAHSLGVFPVIHQMPQIAGDVARRCDADPRGMERLLNALVGLGLLHKHGATYVLPRELAPFVVPGVDGDATGMLDLSSDLYQSWRDLARGVKEGVPLHRLSSDALLNGDPANVRSYIRAVHTNSRQAARRVVEMAPLLPGTTLL
ncbi:MAG TPA: methyltransferase dimerization domain-containing protein, partial [Methylomirabilota bacterium]|nr:methyltransferase dimerization domain-containing protein [Methylomirabilota bacterium]